MPSGSSPTACAAHHGQQVQVGVPADVCAVKVGGAAKCRRGTVRPGARLAASVRYQAPCAMPIRSGTATREARCVVCGSCSSGANPCEPVFRDEGRLGPG